MGHPIPAGQRTITPHLVVKGAAEAIAFYQRAFEAEELRRMPFPGPDGQMKLGHAELRIGDSVVYLADEFPDQGVLGPVEGRSPVTIHIYVTDANAAFAKAVEAGDGLHAPVRYILGRPLRQDRRPVRPPLVDRRAPGRPHPRANARTDGRRHGWPQSD